MTFRTKSVASISFCGFTGLWILILMTIPIQMKANGLIQKSTCRVCVCKTDGTARAASRSPLHILVPRAATTPAAHGILPMDTVRRVLLIQATATWTVNSAAAKVHVAAGSAIHMASRQVHGMFSMSAFRVEKSLRFVSRFQPRPPNWFTGFLHAVASSRPRRPRRPRRLLRDVVS